MFPALAIWHPKRPNQLVVPKSYIIEFEFPQDGHVVKIIRFLLVMADNMKVYLQISSNTESVNNTKRIPDPEPRPKEKRKANMKRTRNCKKFWALDWKRIFFSLGNLKEIS